MLEHDLGPVHVGLDGVHRLFDDELDADRRREMKDHIAAVYQLGQQRLVVDRVDEVLETPAPFDVRDVVDRAGGQIVENQHLVALVE